MYVNVFADLLGRVTFEPVGEVHLSDALPGNRAWTGAACDFGGDEHVDLVYGLRVEQRTEDPTASFDENVGHLLTAELVEQFVPASSEVS